MALSPITQYPQAAPIQIVASQRVPPRPTAPVVFGGKVWRGPSPLTAAYAHLSSPSRIAAASPASRNG